MVPITETPTCRVVRAGQAYHGMWFGPQLEHHYVLQTTDFFYMPADRPHLPYKPSATEDATALIARTDPNEQESVILLPEIESLHP